MTIADKLITIADNTAAVAEAVNTSKTTVSGTVIRVDDVLSNGHTLEIAAAEGTDVYAYGKNLFDMNANQYSGVLYCTSAVVDGTLVVTSKTKNNYQSANFVIPHGELLVGKTITVTGEWVNSGTNVGCLRLGWAKKDNIHAMAGSAIGSNKYSGNTLTRTITAKPSDGGELCIWIYGNYDGTGAVGYTVTYRNIQIEVGTVATEYEEYKGVQTATADANGKVEGIDIVHPTMTIVADKAMECKYFPTSAESVYEKYQQLVQAETDLKAIL